MPQVANASQYLTAMRGLMVQATNLLNDSEHDEPARRELYDKLELMIDLVCQRGNALHRPQIDCMAPLSAMQDT